MKEIPQELLALSNVEIAKRLGVSKQYVLMLRRSMAGTCRRCQSPAEPGVLECKKHRKQRLKRQRTRKGHKPWQPGSRGRPPFDAPIK